MTTSLLTTWRGVYSVAHMFFCFWGVWVWLVEYGQAIGTQNLPLSGTRCYKKPELLGLKKHTRFQYTVPSSIAPKGILLLSQWHCFRILQSHRRPVIQYNVGQTWGLLTAKTTEKQLKLELGKAKFILVWHSTPQILPNGIDSWLEQPYVMATLRMSRRSGQSELKRCIHLTDRIAHFVTWMVANCWINRHLTAKCPVPSGLSHRLCCNKRAFRVCIAGCFNCIKGNYLSALHLTLYEIHMLSCWRTGRL